MIRILTLALAALALVAAGCGDDNNDNASTTTGTTATGTGTAPATTPPAETTGSGKTIDVDMRNISFDPKSVTAKVGDTIKWENYDTVDHNVVAESGEDFKSDNFGKGGEFEYKLDKAGTIKYVCTIHPGMEGTITVTK